MRVEVQLKVRVAVGHRVREEVQLETVKRLAVVEYLE